MKKYIFLLLSACWFTGFIYAQEILQVYNAGDLLYEVSADEIESITFRNNSSLFNFENENVVGIPISEIDSIIFSENKEEEPDRIISIVYEGNYVSVSNPLEDRGVTVSVNQCNVVVTADSGIYGVEYHLSGKSENGSFYISSDKACVVVLEDLNITHPYGAAIAIENDVVCNINITGSNVLSDGVSSTKSAAIRSKGDIIFSGQGSLQVSGLIKHAVSGEKLIIVDNGDITILQAVTDGLHSEGFIMNGGMLQINADSDGIDAGGTAVEINDGIIKIVSLTDDVKGIKSDASVTINGGTIDISVEGAQSKAVSTRQNFIFNDGSLVVKASGKTVLEASGSGYETSYCSGVKCRGNLIVNGGNISIELTSSNNGGKGLSADGDIIINAGDLQITTAGNGGTYTNINGTADSYTSSCIKSDSNISVLGGSVVCSSSGTGGKGISADGILVIGKQGTDNSELILTVSTSGERFLVSGGSGGANRPGGNPGSSSNYANPKAVKSDGNLTVNSGTITINCTQNDDGGEGMESKSTLSINGGLVSINSYDDCINASNHIEITDGTIYCVSGENDGIDSNGTLSISGGTIIANGGRSPEGGIDCDNNRFAITGGLIIGTGGSTNNPTTNACTQRSVKYTGTAGNAVCITNSSDEIILLYQMPAYTGSGNGGSSMVLLFSDSRLDAGNYTLYHGGNISGGTTINGYNTGGTYTGGSGKSFTINSMFTTVQ